MKRGVAIAIILCLTGCVGTPKTGGVSWLKPWTWGSTSEARKVEKLEARYDEAREKAIKAAQRTAHETDIALASAEPSRPVEVATEANQQTVTLLDQVAGPVSVTELETIRRQVALLLSENQRLRKEGEELRSSSRNELGRLSGKLLETQALLDKANSDLPAALRREAETANKYRTLIWGTAILGVLAALGYIGLLYVKIVYGGVPMAVGRGLAQLRASHPDAAQVATQAFDTYLNRREQQQVARYS